MLLNRCLKLKSSKKLKNFLIFSVPNTLNKSNVINSTIFNTISKRNLCSTKLLLEKTTITQTSNKQLQNKIEGSYLDEILFKSNKNDELKTTGQKVKKAAENTFFYSICIVSLATTSIIIYYLFDYFWASDSPQRIYSDALKIVRKDEVCLTTFGSNISAHGETSGRGRRRHIAHKRYAVDGVQRIRIVFYIKGKKKSGKVTAELANNNGSWDYRFLLVETDGLITESHVLIDNR